MVKRLALHQVQTLEDVVQMFCDIFDLQNRFRDGAFINYGEFALASHIEADPNLRKQFHLSRQEYNDLTPDEQKKKREKFCSLKAPQLTKNKNKKIMVSTDGLMSAPIHKFAGSKPSQSKRPTGNKVRVTKGTKNKHQRKKAVKRKVPEEDDDLNVLDILQDQDLDFSDDEDAYDDVTDDEDVILEDETSNVNAPIDYENVLDTQSGHSIFGKQLQNLPAILDVGTTDEVPKRTLDIENERSQKIPIAAPIAKTEENLKAPILVPLLVNPRGQNALCPDFSIVQFNNENNQCWANACMVMQRYTFKITNALETRPLYDVNGMEQFPALYANNFSQFVCDMATLNENYVVESTEDLLTTFLDEYFRGRTKVGQKLADEQNEPGKISLYICSSYFSN